MWKIGCWGRDTAGDSGFFPFFLSPPSFFSGKDKLLLFSEAMTGFDLFFLPQEAEQPIRLFRPHPIVLFSAVERREGLVLKGGGAGAVLGSR